MSSNSNSQGSAEQKGILPYLRSVQWGTVASWVGTLLAVTILLLVLLKINPFAPQQVMEDPAVSDLPSDLAMPNLAAGLPVGELIRAANLDTTTPEGTRQFATRYTVVEGDSIFGIAKQFGITPETIMWANYDLLRDDPTFLAPGWSLIIPPTNGVYYKWKEGDTLQKVAEKLYVSVEDIASWPGNRMEVENPQVTDQEYVMVPGGYRELVQWIVPVDFAPLSGATKTIAGPGGCVISESSNRGTGYFVWPVGATWLSGFDFTSYHLGIDIAAGVGTPVYASDGGTVVYAGWNDSGYGYMVAIDHNNGYKTIYAHLTTPYVECGQDVYQSALIGLSGSTGKSTGGHLHFEIRYNGQYINPWQVLP